MFHNQLIIQSQADVGLDSAKQVLINHFMEDSTDKIVFQGLLKDVLLMSLREILLNKEFKQMKEKVKLINCPAGMKPIGPRDGITGSALVPLHDEDDDKEEDTGMQHKVFFVDEDDDKEEDTGMQHKVFFVIKSLLEFFLTNHEEMNDWLYKPKFFIQRCKINQKSLWAMPGQRSQERSCSPGLKEVIAIMRSLFQLIVTSPFQSARVQINGSNKDDEYEGHEQDAHSRCSKPKLSSKCRVQIDASDNENEHEVPNHPRKTVEKKGDVLQQKKLRSKEKSEKSSRPHPDPRMIAPGEKRTIT
ncbi:hypothetical protein EV361DRAFT_872674 [Lentinula raphanica]|nr:hypothetical protein EV361DRAFT_872674 [Lentinula raphanica]